LVASRFDELSLSWKLYFTAPVGAGTVTAHESPPVTAVQLPPAPVVSVATVGFTLGGTCAAVGALPLTVSTVIVSVAAFGETNCGARPLDDVLVRGTRMFTVALGDVMGVFVGWVMGCCGVGADPPPPPPHPASRARDATTASARGFM
jgi:hypothetical protein